MFVKKQLVKPLVDLSIFSGKQPWTEINYDEKINGRMEFLTGRSAELFKDWLDETEQARKERK